MSTFLLRVEAIESRIASYSCPRGASGRVHSLRLRRCFTKSAFRKQEALRLDIPSPKEHDPPKQTLSEQSPDYDNGDNGRTAGKDSSGELEQDRRDGRAEVPEAKGIHIRGGREEKHKLVYGRYLLRKRLATSELGDVPPDVQGIDAVPNDAIEEQKKLHAALQRGDPQVVLKALIAHIKLDGFDSTSALLESMPPTMFSEILRCIDPIHFITRYQNLYQGVSPAWAYNLGITKLIDEDGYYKFCSRFLDHAVDILNRRGQNFPLALSDYKYLLKCARATGNSSAATAIWNALRETRSNDQTGRGELMPDAECYNDYLATKCWQGSVNPYERFRLRVIPDNTTPRTWEVPPYSLKGHLLGPRRGLKAQASHLFRQMVESGVPGNEETFCLMITAMGREGDLDSIANILKRVWQIHVEALLAADETSVPSARSYPEDSPFYPSNKLLFTLAHAYGTNNNIPLALRLVDYVSSQYSLPIPIEVWNELFQWTYVLSLTPRVLKRKWVPVQHGKEAGRLPPQAVSSFWDTMISQPYNARPTLDMYSRFMSNLAYRQRFGEMQLRMEEGRALHRAAVREYARSRAIFHSTRRTSPTWLRDQRARDLVYARLRLAINRQHIRKWVRLLIHHGSRSLYDTEWATHNLPKVIKNWMLFLPRVVTYPIRSGDVRLYTQSRGLHRKSATIQGANQQKLQHGWRSAGIHEQGAKAGKL